MKFKLKNKKIEQFYNLNENHSDILHDIISLNNKLNRFEYGSGDDFEHYHIKTPEEFEQSRVGICWDYVPYEAYYFNRYFTNIKYETYFWQGVNDDDQPTHTFLIFNFNDKWYWFESAWKSDVGVYEFSNKKDALNYIVNELIKSVNNYKESYLTKYDALDKNIFGMKFTEFMPYMWDKCDDKPVKESDEIEQPKKINDNIIKYE